MCLGALMVRLAWIQLVKHSYYTARAEHIIGRHWPIPAPGVDIRDRNGVALALNLKLYSIAADPKLLGDLPAAAKRLSAVLRLPEPKLRGSPDGPQEGWQSAARSPVRFALLRENVDEPTAGDVQGAQVARPEGHRAPATASTPWAPSAPP